MGMVDYTRRSSRKRLLAGDIPHWIKNSARGPYIAQVCISCPDWVDRRELQALKQRAAEITRRTGKLHVLDHRVPLNHPRVCGLTVPWNLRIIHWRANLSKGNDFCPEQKDLFERESPVHVAVPTEQLRLFDV